MIEIPPAIEIHLSVPIQAHGETVAVLTLRRPVWEDLFVMDGIKGDQERSLHFAARLAGVPPSSLKKLPITDALAIQQAMSPFFQISAPAGPTPPETLPGSSDSDPLT